MKTDQLIHLQVNGKPESIPAQITIKEYLEIKGINPHVVACELNLNIIKRDHLSSTYLNEGDQLEILQMMGGG